MTQLIKKLSDIKGNGTSLVTFSVPAGSQLSLFIKRINTEMATAENIKSRVNRKSVVSALKSIKSELLLYNKTPPNGLIVFAGTQDDRMMCIPCEPPEPLNLAVYHCDNKFHLESIQDMLQNEDTYGFLVVDGNSATIATVRGNTINIKSTLHTNLIGKTRRGGSSSNRYREIRHNERVHYAKRVAEEVCRMFIDPQTTLPGVLGIVLAGSADFKDVVGEYLDQRLARIILGSIDVAYGGKSGLFQAIELSSSLINNQTLMYETSILQEFFKRVETNNLVVYGEKNTMSAIEQGAVKNLILWRQSPHINLFINFQTLYLVSNSTPEGNMFVNGFEGMGAFLLFPIETIDDDYDNSDSE